MSAEKILPDQTMTLASLGIFESIDALKTMSRHGSGNAIDRARLSLPTDLEYAAPTRPSICPKF